MITDTFVGVIFGVMLSIGFCMIYILAHDLFVSYCEHIDMMQNFKIGDMIQTIVKIPLSEISNRIQVLEAEQKLLNQKLESLTPKTRKKVDPK